MKLLFLLMILAGCGLTSQSKVGSVDSVFKHDLWMHVDGVTHMGTGVVDVKSNRLNIEFNAKKSEFISITTCHRHVILKDKNDSSYEYTYSPERGLEQRYCPMTIRVYYKDGRFSFGFLDFKYDPELTLTANVTCNGRNKAYKGSSVCHSKFGLVQGIRFSKRVDVGWEGDCPKPEYRDGLWYVRTRINKCVYDFYTSNEAFRYTTLGYDEVRR